jgi:FMN phosphatase YigB (HAD superfamily)
MSAVKENLRNISFIAVDYGGVLAHHYCEPYQSLLAEKLEVPIEQAKSLISEHSEQGRLFRTDQITMVEFWHRVLALAGTKAKVRVSDLQLLWSMTYIIDMRMFEIMRALKVKQQVKLCLFANTDRERFAYMEETYRLSDIFDVMVCSFQTGLIKPSPESFLHLLDVCGQASSPENILFIDDRELTAKQAAELGITSFTYRGYDSLVDFLINSCVLRKEDFLATE